MKATLETPIVFTNQGMQIVGMLHRPSSCSKAPAVVLFHGLTGSKTEAHFLFVKMARKLAGQGIAALRFDFRGSGDSEGDFEDVTISGEISDGLKSIEFLCSQSFIDDGRIGVLGLSMGGVVGAAVAGTLQEKVQSCVLLNPVGRPMLDLSYIAQSQQIDVKSYPIEWSAFLFGQAFFEDVKSIEPLDSIRKARCPVLVINGSNDQSVQPVRSKEYADAVQAAGGTVELHIIQGADHVFSTLVWERNVINKSCEWFLSTL